jgi:hypothetical protein
MLRALPPRYLEQQRLEKIEQEKEIARIVQLQAQEDAARELARDEIAKEAMDRMNALTFDFSWG